MNLQKIITFTTYGDEDPKALTREEFVRLPDDYADRAWHLAPSKEAAIAAHDTAVEVFNHTSELDFYDHSNPPQMRWDHAFDMTYVIISDDEEGKDITGAHVRAALLQKLCLSDDQLLDEMNIIDTIRTVQT